MQGRAPQQRQRLQLRDSPNADDDDERQLDSGVEVEHISPKAAARTAGSSFSKHDASTGELGSNSDDDDRAEAAA